MPYSAAVQRIPSSLCDGIQLERAQLKVSERNVVGFGEDSRCKDYDGTQEVGHSPGVHRPNSIRDHSRQDPAEYRDRIEDGKDVGRETLSNAERDGARLDVEDGTK